MGFTSGSFDLIHSTHIEVLKKAKDLCDVLVVGLNSDESIRKYKGKDRPIRDEEERLAVLSAFEYIDYVFFFDEKNNNRNIEELKPDVYIKGGDYDKSKLSSAQLVESYGGKVIVLKTPTHISTTSIVDSILDKRINKIVSDKHEYSGLVLLDRDGVINEEIDYLHKVEDLKLVDGAAEAIAKLNNRNYAVAVVSNQPGIKMNLHTKEQTFAINREIVKAVHKKKARIDKFYSCPDINCESKYKKPNPFMLSEAIEDFNLLDDENIYVIGDSRSDAKAAKNIGLKSIGVKTGKALKDVWVDEDPDVIVNDITEAVDIILED